MNPEQLTSSEYPKCASCVFCRDLARRAMTSVLGEKGYTPEEARALSEATDLTVAIDAITAKSCEAKQSLAELTGVRFAERYKTRP